MKSDKYKNLHFYISFFISLALLILVVLLVDFKNVIPALLSVDPRILIIIMALSVVHHVLMYCDRWRRILSYLGYHFTLDEVFLVHLGTGPFHLVMPIQTGEALTAYALAKKRNDPVAVFIGTIAYGKYLNLLATLILLVIGLAMTKKFPLPGAKIGILIFLAIVLFGFLLEIKVVRNLFIKMISVLGKKAEKTATDLFAVFAKVSFSKKVFLLAYSVAFQFIEVFLCHMLFMSMGIVIPFENLLPIIGIILLLTNIPVTVAGAGTREALCLLLLIPYTDQATAVAAGIAYTFTQYIWPMIVGAPWIRTVVSDSFFKNKGC